MQKKSLRQILTIFSLFILLVLPTAIVGYSNFSTLVNKAFGKPFNKDDSAFIVTTQSTDKISKGSQFSLKVSTLAPKTLPLKYMVAFVEFDKNYVDVKSIQSQNPAQFKVAAFQNGYLIYPAGMVQPTNLEDALPEKCFDNKTCSLNENAYTTVTFSVSAILLHELTEQQRPFKITIIGAAETTSTIIWNQKTDLPALKLGQFVKNSSPTFLTEPNNYLKAGKEFSYEVATKDEDGDPVLLSLECPDKVFCTKVQKAPAGLTIEDNIIYWKNPVYRKEPYEITIYANDGKSLTTQTFNLFVLEQGTSYFSCQFSPAIAVKILDFRVETPLVIVANSTESLKDAKVTLTRNGTTEKTFSYTFSPSKKSVILDRNSSPSLIYQFNEGAYTGKAEFTSDSGEKFVCELENPTVSLGSLIKMAAKQTVKQVIDTVYAAAGINSGINNAPVFLTDPMLPAAGGGSSPSVSFIYGPTYSFTLRAQDVDGDPMQHTIVAKPSWANVAVSSSSPATGASVFTVQLTGTPQERNAGSNLFSISINDGYGHYITRTWVINVDYPNNDIPRVLLTAPTNFTLPNYCPPRTKTPVTLRQGQAFMMVFDATDRNQIVKFSLHYTKNLGSTTKTTLIPSISYKMRCMSVSTAKMPPGDYYFILSATDNYNPPATGSAYTDLVRILPPLPKPTTTPKPTAKPTATPTATPTTTATATATPTPTATATATPTPTATAEPLPQPNEPLIQITSPKQNDKLRPENFQLVVSLTASKDAEITKSNVIVKLDDTDITDKVLFSVDTGKTMTISYKPSTLLDYAIHSITVQILDSKKKTAEQKLSFTIVNEDDSDTNSVTIFGFTISKDLYTIFIVALILITILILLPIIMYFAFRNQNNDSSVSKRPLGQQPQAPMAPQLRTPTASFAIPPQASTTARVQQIQPPIAMPIPRPPVSGTLPPYNQVATMQQPITYPVKQPQPIAQTTPKQALDAFVSQSPTMGQPQRPAPVPPVTTVAPRPQMQTSAPLPTMNNSQRPVFQPTVSNTLPVNVPPPVIQSPQLPQRTEQSIASNNVQPVAPRPVPQPPVNFPVIQPKSVPQPVAQPQKPPLGPHPIPQRTAPPTVPGKVATAVTSAAQQPTAQNSVKPVEKTVPPAFTPATNIQQKQPPAIQTQMPVVRTAPITTLPEVQKPTPITSQQVANAQQTQVQQPDTSSTTEKAVLPPESPSLPKN